MKSIGGRLIREAGGGTAGRSVELDERLNGETHTSG